LLGVAPAIALIATPASAQALRADQEAALDLIMEEVEPSLRDTVRPQMRAMVAALNPAQIAAMTAELKAKPKSASAPAAASERRATADDLAYNRTQYEPAIRKAWTARKAFDEFVDARLAAACPPRDRYAVYGAGYRYELGELSASWQRASWNADIDVEVLGSGYAPDDGRYQFDFSRVRMSFDRAGVARAVAAACGDYISVAGGFQIEAGARVAQGDHAGAHTVQERARARVEPIAATLSETLQKEAPADPADIVSALQNARRVN
jgi:hypothetical protein